MDERNIGDLPPNAAPPTQPFQSWMPHAAVGGGLCQDLNHDSNICLFLASFTELVRMVMNGWRPSASRCFFLSCHTYPLLQLASTVPLQPFPWISSTFNLISAFTFLKETQTALAIAVRSIHTYDQLVCIQESYIVLALFAITFQDAALKMT